MFPRARHVVHPDALALRALEAGPAAYPPLRRAAPRSLRVARRRGRARARCRRSCAARPLSRTRGPQHSVGRGARRADRRHRAASGAARPARVGVRARRPAADDHPRRARRGARRHAMPLSCAGTSRDARDRRAIVTRRRRPQPSREEVGWAAHELAARRREARARALAHGGPRPRRPRRPRSRQRPLPHELLGDEGLRRVRLPARGRARAHLPRGLGGGRGPHGLDAGRAPVQGVRRRRSAPADGACPRPRARGVARVRAHRARALARDAGVGPHGGGADDLHGATGSAASATRSTRRLSSPRRVRSRASRRSSGCGSRTRSPPLRWSTAGSSSSRA